MARSCRVLFCVVSTLMITMSVQLDHKYDQAWTDFVRCYNKTYPTTTEELRRREIFDWNMNLIDKHNNYSKNSSRPEFEMGPNAFTDMNITEFVETHTGLHVVEDNRHDVDPREGDNGHHYGREDSTRSPNKPYPRVRRQTQTVPCSLNYTALGYVTPVKNQDPCGSCWTFSTTGVLEGQYFKKTGKLVSLSEQNVLDCCSSSTYSPNAGCGGGNVGVALQCVIDERGIDYESSYPYQRVQGSCRYNSANSAFGSTYDYTYISNAGDELNMLQTLVNVGPLSVYMDADQSSFKSYKSGIYSDTICSNTKLNHAVLLVGYGRLNEIPYWLVKNSWGTSWGLQGYVMIARNFNNLCGLANHITYPLV